jgi:elongation factor 1 alpha-like protein
VKIDESKNNDINMVIIGHVDAGKSTLMGHLLHLLGYVGHQEIRKNEKMSVEYGKASFHFAWIMD